MQRPEAARFPPGCGSRAGCPPGTGDRAQGANPAVPLLGLAASTSFRARQRVGVACRVRGGGAPRRVRPGPGVTVTPRLCGFSSGSLVGSMRNSRSIVRNVTSISMVANDAPMHRIMPPPNGIHANGFGALTDESVGIELLRVGETLLRRHRQLGAGQDRVALGNHPLPQLDSCPGPAQRGSQHGAGALRLGDRRRAADRCRPRRPPRSGEPAARDGDGCARWSTPAASRSSRDRPPASSAVRRRCRSPASARRRRSGPAAAATAHRRAR